MLKMTCPVCDSSLHIPDEISFLNCTRCGSELVVTRGEGFAALQLIHDSEELVVESEAEAEIEDSVAELEYHKVQISSLEQYGNRKSQWQAMIPVAVIVILLCCFWIALISSSNSSNRDGGRRVANTPTGAVVGSLPTNTQAPESATPTRTTEPSLTPTPTATNSPTATRLPSPTPTPTRGPDAYAVILSNANLRSGPGSNFDVVGSASRGEEFPVYGRNEAGNWLLLSQFESIWIWIELVELSVDVSYISAPPTATPTSTLFPTSTPNLTATTRAQTPILGPTEVSYLTELLELIEIYEEAFISFSSLTHRASINPMLMGDEDWLLEAVLILLIISLANNEVRELSPPPRFREAHQELLTAANHFNQFVNWFTEGVDERNQAKLARANTQMQLGTAAVKRATAILQAFLE